MIKKRKPQNLFGRKAEKLAAELKDGSLRILKARQRRNAREPPQLYDLTELQRDAQQKVRLLPKETLNLMQSLYERHKVLTYPRTDSDILVLILFPP